MFYSSGLMTESEWWPSGAEWMPGALFPIASSISPTDSTPKEVVAQSVSQNSSYQRTEQQPNDKSHHMTCGQVFEVARGVDDVQRQLRCAVYGPNAIITTVTPIPVILLKEVSCEIQPSALCLMCHHCSQCV